MKNDTTKIIDERVISSLTPVIANIKMSVNVPIKNAINSAIFPIIFDYFLFTFFFPNIICIASFAGKYIILVIILNKIINTTMLAYIRMNIKKSLNAFL